MLKMRIF